MTNQPEREIDARLADWVDGRLGERERERFVAELRVSPQLRKDLEEYERTVAALRAALQAPTRPVQVAPRVLDAIAARNQGRGAGPRWRQRSFVWSLASAAALLVLALWVNDWSSQPKTDAVAQVDLKQTAADKNLREQENVVSEVSKHDLATVPPASRPAGAVESEAVPTEVASGTAPVREGARDERPSSPVPNPAPTVAPVEKPLVESLEAVTPGASKDNEKQAAAPKVAGAKEPAVPPELRGAPPQGGGGGAGSGGGLFSDRGARADGEQLPLVVVQGAAIAQETKLSDGKPVTAGPTTGGPTGAPAQSSRAPAAPAAPAPSGTDAPALTGEQRKGREAADVPLQLDAFFKRQMTMAGDAGAGAQGWSVGGLQFTPLPPASLKKEPAKEKRESDGDRRRAGLDDKDARTGPVERTWLVEGSKEELQLVVRQLSLFVRSAGMELTTGETAAATLPPLDPPAAAGTGIPADQFAAGARALPRSRLVLRFSARPR